MIKSHIAFTEFLRPAFWLGLALHLLIGSAPALASAPDTTFLEPEQAFELAVEQPQPGQVALRWQIAPGYYLYRDRMQVTALPAGTRADVTLPAGERKTDPNFGPVDVYHDAVRVMVNAPGATSLQLVWQGCAEEGLCYPPQRKTVGLASMSASPAAAATAPGDGRSLAAPGLAAVTSDRGIASLLASQPLIWTVPLFLLLGAGLAFTPCVLPMLPILSSIVVGSGARPRRALALTFAFVLAMSAVYAMLGVGAALAGRSLQATLQHPVALGAFAALFVVFAFAMFGWYELQLPAFLRERLSRAAPRGGSLPGAAAMGALSAVLVSPCMTAPLAGTLLSIAQTGKVLDGAVLLFALGLGMGAPMLVVGALGARALPRPGPWMTRVKGAFGFLLLATAIGMIERVAPAPFVLLLWGAWLMALALTLWHLAAPDRGRLLARSAAFVAGLWASAMVLGAAAGAADPWQPLLAAVAAASGRAAPTAPGGSFETITDPQVLQARLDAARASGRPALVDFSADWCTSCKTLDREVFGDPGVRDALATVVRLRADVTASDAAQQAFMRDHQVMGPPTVMLFDAQGRERREDRLVGEFTAAELLRRQPAGGRS